MTTTKRRRTDTNSAVPVAVVPTTVQDCVSSNHLAHNTAYHTFHDDTHVREIQAALLDWFDTKQRTNMPWRKAASTTRTKEVRKKEAKTQVATVIDYYNRWIEAFPTIYDLATADLEKVNTLWAGLGYYSRAKRLWEGARKVVQEMDGQLPGTAAELEKQIPGVGPYTAGAIASIVFNQQTPLVDGNVIRVLARVRAVGADMKKTSVVALFWQLAAALVPADRPGDFNQALMELGATVCRPTDPNCDACPLKSHCYALQQLKCHGKQMHHGQSSTNHQESHECEHCPSIEQPLDHEDYTVTRYPVKSEKKPPRDEECSVTIVQKVLPDGASYYLISKRPDKGLLAGLWEFPSVELGNKSTTYAARAKKNTAYLSSRYGLDVVALDAHRQDLEHVVHLFSHIRKVYHVEWVRYNDNHEDAPPAQQHDTTEGGESRWLPEDELVSAPIPTGLKKALKLLDKAQHPKQSAHASKSKTKAKANGSASITSFFAKAK
ncbi:DNA glycosylase [Gongronella butleri]|nr:DNA glycosylase [Gongronella butleri]